MLLLTQTSLLAAPATARRDPLPRPVRQFNNGKLHLARSAGTRFARSPCDSAWCRRSRSRSPRCAIFRAGIFSASDRGVANSLSLNRRSGRCKPPVEAEWLDIETARHRAVFVSSADEFIRISQPSRPQQVGSASQPNSGASAPPNRRHRCRGMYPRRQSL